MTAGGHIRLPRLLMQHWLWQDPDQLRAFLMILMLANWEEGTSAGRYTVPLKAGQVSMGLRAWADRLGWTVSKVNRFMKKLEESGLITRETDGPVMIITVTNWEQFNGPVTGTRAGTKSEREPERNRNASRNEIGTREPEPITLNSVVYDSFPRDTGTRTEREPERKRNANRNGNGTRTGTIQINNNSINNNSLKARAHTREEVADMMDYGLCGQAFVAFCDTYGRDCIPSTPKANNGWTEALMKDMTMGTSQTDAQAKLNTAASSYRAFCLARSRFRQDAHNWFEEQGHLEDWRAKLSAFNSTTQDKEAQTVVLNTPPGL